MASDKGELLINQDPKAMDLASLKLLQGALIAKLFLVNGGPLRLIATPFGRCCVRRFVEHLVNDRLVLHGK